MKLSTGKLSGNKHFSNLARTKIYFFLIAVLVLPSLIVLSYRWQPWGAHFTLESLPGSRHVSQKHNEIGELYNQVSLRAFVKKNNSATENVGPTDSLKIADKNDSKSFFPSENRIGQHKVESMRKESLINPDKRSENLSQIQNTTTKPYKRAQSDKSIEISSKVDQTDMRKENPLHESRQDPNSPNSSKSSPKNVSTVPLSQGNSTKSAHENMHETDKQKSGENISSTEHLKLSNLTSVSSRNDSDSLPTEQTSASSSDNTVVETQQKPQQSDDSQKNNLTRTDSQVSQNKTDKKVQSDTEKLNHLTLALSPRQRAILERYRVQHNLRKLGRLGTRFQTITRNKIGRTTGTSDDEDAALHRTLPPGQTVRPNACRGCFKMDFPRTINEPRLCRGNTTVKVLILISSNPVNFEARKAIRDTWGAKCREPNGVVKCAFIVGQPADGSVNVQLRQESDELHDLIQIDFQDSYRNLTYKTISGFQWAREHCGQAEYVMKTDDDMYVNTRLLPRLLDQAPPQKLLGGACWGQASPHRDSNSKWYVPYQLFPGPLYPPICSGTGYVLSSDVVNKTLQVARDIPFFYLEDVYVALCARKIEVQPVKLFGFYNELKALEPCNYDNLYITSHGLSAKDLRQIWSQMKGCKDLVPKRLFMSQLV